MTRYDGPFETAANLRKLRLSELMTAYEFEQIRRNRERAAIEDRRRRVEQMRRTLIIRGVVLILAIAFVLCSRLDAQTIL